MKLPRKSLCWVCLFLVFALVSMASMCQAATQLRLPGSLPQVGTPEEEEAELTQEAVEETPQGGGVLNLLALASVSPTGNGHEVQVKVIVSNGGDGMFHAPFDVRWYPYHTSGEVGCSWEIEAEAINLGPVSKECTYTYQQNGLITWRVVVDAEGVIAEANKVDNVVRGEVEINASEGEDNKLNSPQDCRWRAFSEPGKIILEWDYPQLENVDGFSVYNMTTGEVLRVGADQRRILVSGLTLEAQYHFDVRAVHSGQESPAGACEIDVTTGQ